MGSKLSLESQYLEESRIKLKQFYQEVSRNQKKSFSNEEGSYMIGAIHSTSIFQIL